MMWRGVFLPALLLVQLWVVPDSVAQAPEKVYRLGVLSVSPGTLQRMRAVMFPELARLGFTEGRNFVVEARFGPMEELPALARQLAAANPDAIIAAGNAIGAAQQATSTTADHRVVHRRGPDCRGLRGNPHPPRWQCHRCRYAGDGARCQTAATVA